MKRTFVASGRTGNRNLGTASSILCTLAFALLVSSPAAAADPDPCRGHWVRTLAGPHAVLRLPMSDVASLRHSLPALEASIRTVVAQDPSLGTAVADALVAAIRDGSGITERPMRRDEAVLWMANQPKPGEYEAISPACLRLQRNYDAFEITVEIPAAVPAARTPACSVQATRDCALENPSIAIDISGSSPGARVTLTMDGRAATPVGGPGEHFSVPDSVPYDLEAVFTVRAEGAPAAARTARVFRFLMPKICGNLAYLGEAPPKTLAAGGAPLSCEKSARVGRCIAPVAPVEPPAAVADLCEDGWVARPFLFAFFPMDGEQQRDILLPTGPARESFEVEGGYGVGFSLERRFGAVLGIEGTAMFGRGDSEYELDNGTATGEDSHPTNFYALTFGPNFHLLGCGGVDLYIGPFLGYGGFADPNYWVFDHHFAASFDGRFVWGAQLGLDIPFGDGPWGFHGGVRYFDLSQDTDAGSIQVDPLIVEAGLSYRF